MMKPIMIPVALTAALLVAVPVRAQAPQQMRITYTDLDLGTDAGTQALHARMEAAVAKLCPREGGTAYALAVPSCRTHARRTARTQLQTALAEARSSQQLASR